MVVGGGAGGVTERETVSAAARLTKVPQWLPHTGSTVLWECKRFRLQQSSHCALSKVAWKSTTSKPRCFYCGLTDGAVEGLCTFDWSRPTEVPVMATVDVLVLLRAR